MKLRNFLLALTFILASFGLAACGDEDAGGDSGNSEGEGSSDGEKVTLHVRSEEHTSELQSRFDHVCRLLLEKKKSTHQDNHRVPNQGARHLLMLSCTAPAGLLTAFGLSVQQRPWTTLFPYTTLFRSLLALTFILASFGLAACGDEYAGGDSGNSEGEGSSDGEKVTLHVAALESAYGAEVWENIAEQYEALNENVMIELTTAKNLEEVVRPEMQAGNYPDVFLLATDREEALTETLIKE